MVLGVAFESGSDENHFCKPTDVAVSEKTGDIFVADGYCNSRILKFASDGRLKQIISKNHYKNGRFCAILLLLKNLLYIRSIGWFLLFLEGDWNVPHSLALFDESDVLCVADREGERVDCMKAGIERPLYANRDETGQKITSYKRIGRPYAIDAKGKV